MNEEQQDNTIEQDEAGHTAPNTDTTTVSADHSIESHAALGPIIAVLVLILVVILGGLYMWGSALTRTDITPAAPINTGLDNREPETPRTKADVQINSTLSSSDDLGAIKSDLESTELENLDQELDAIYNELDN